jgi:hypothetical protein
MGTSDCENRDLADGKDIHLPWKPVSLTLVP